MLKSHQSKRFVTLLIMDILLIAELTLALNKAMNTTDDFSAVFLHTYIPLFFPTVAVFFFILRKLKNKATAEAAAEAGIQAQAR